MWTAAAATTGGRSPATTATATTAAAPTEAGDAAFAVGAPSATRGYGRCEGSARPSFARGGCLVRLPVVARTVTHAATALALLAALPILSACMMPAPPTASTFDSLPTFG
jgi:hypothetical protein